MIALDVSQLSLPLDYAEAELTAALAQSLSVSASKILSCRILQQAVDARRGKVRFSLTVRVELADGARWEAPPPGRPPLVQAAVIEEYRELENLQKTAHVVAGASCPCINVDQVMQGQDAPATVVRPRPIVIGAGPCGLFAALLLARQGLKPILLERGKAAGDRARDVTGFWRRGLAFDPSSNVQFGEGGAGTFSDGKLYTQIRDREHRIPWLLKEMVRAGAPEDILVKSRPHIGTDRLIKVVRHLRQEIIELGGDVHFSRQVTDFRLKNGAMKAIQTSDGHWWESDVFILAVGHSARDTFELLHKHGVPCEPKSFSIGVRVEHPQGHWDKALYGDSAGHSKLGAAPYKFVWHSPQNRAAYSFCMCPGGLVVASSSELNSVVTNGMSSYARAEANANAGFMVDVTPQDYGLDHPLAGIAYQRRWEKAAFALGGGNYFAPAQRMGDFMAKRASSGPGAVLPSYQPGVTWTDLRACLPDFVADTLRLAIPTIDKKLRGFWLEDAVLTGVETRSSSPVRLTRDAETFECVGVKNLFPAGEGAGYAGGIISAAADGMRVAEAVLKRRAR